MPNRETFRDSEVEINGGQLLDTTLLTAIELVHFKIPLTGSAARRVAKDFVSGIRRLAISEPLNRSKEPKTVASRTHKRTDSRLKGMDGFARLASLRNVPKSQLHVVRELKFFKNNSVITNDTPFFGPSHLGQ